MWQQLMFLSDRETALLLPLSPTSYKTAAVVRTLRVRLVWVTALFNVFLWSHCVYGKSLWTTRSFYIQYAFNTSQWLLWCHIKYQIPLTFIWDSAVYLWKGRMFKCSKGLRKGRPPTCPTSSPSHQFSLSYEHSMALFLSFSRRLISCTRSSGLSENSS